MEDNMVRIRRFRDSDSKQVRQLFEGNIATGRASPRVLGLKGLYKSVPGYMLYMACLSGLLLWMVGWRVVGATFASAGVIFFAAVRRRLSNYYKGYVASSLNADLKDISAHYEMDGGRKSCFWVAELSGEVVGSIAMDTNSLADPASAELRRMGVSDRHLRRGIARQLVQTLLAHAQEHGFSFVVLTTSTCQVAAINLYTNLGFVTSSIVWGKILGVFSIGLVTMKFKVID